MPVAGRSVGEELSQEFRNRMDAFYIYSETIKEQLISQQYMYHSNAKIAKIQRQLEAELDRAEKEAIEFQKKGLVQAYRLGYESATGKPYRASLSNTRALLGKATANDPYSGMQSEFERDLAAAFRRTRQSIRTEPPNNWRFTNREVNRSRGEKDAMSRIRWKRSWARKKGYLTARVTETTRMVREGKQVAAEGWNVKQKQLDVFGDLIEAKVPLRWRFNSYMNMLSLRHTQAAYNRGAIEGYKAMKIKALRIHDGPECGLRSHNDETKADQLVVTIADAARYALSHPNCIRTFHPATDVEPPPSVEEEKWRNKIERTQTVVSKAYKDYASLASRVALTSAREFSINMAKDTAGYFLQDLMQDQMFRRQTIDAITRNHPVLQAVDRRVGRVVRAIQDRAGIIGRRPPTEWEVHEAAEYWMNRWLEDESVAMPRWAEAMIFREREREAVVARKLKRVAGGEDLQDAMWFDVYRDLQHRKVLTHNQLNVINSISESYGQRFFETMANTFFDNANRLPNAAMAFQRRYAPDSVLARKAAERTGAALRNEVYQRVLKKPGDKLLENIFPFTDSLGKVRVVRTSNKLFDQKHMGLRYDWNTRYVKVQSTLVNRYKYLAAQELRKAAEEAGVATKEGYKAKVFARSMYDSVRYRSRKDILDELGYNAGLLTRITFKPHELVRLGFRFDPAMGWRKPTPLPQLSISTPKIFGLTGRTTLRLNRGFTADNRFMQNYPPYAKFLRPPEFRANGIRPRPQVTAADSAKVDGIRLRTVTQEITLAFGDLMNLNRFIPVGTGAARYIIPKVPYISQVGMRAGTFIGRMESMADAKWYLKNVGVAGFYEDMAIISWFAELRALGFNWFHFPKIIGIKHEDVPKLAQAFNKVWNGYRVEFGLATLLARAYAVRYTPGVAVDNVAAYIERYMRLYDEKYPDVDAITRQREIRRIRNLILHGGDV